MIDDKLNKVIKDVLRIDPNGIDENQRFIDMDIWDSMTFMMFIVSIEEEFNISLTTDEILNINCIRSAREIVANKI